MNEQEEISRVRELYTAEHGYPSKTNIQKMSGISMEIINKALRDVESYTRFVKPKKRKEFSKFITFKPEEIWMSDLMDCSSFFTEFEEYPFDENDGYRYVLIIIDVFSKYLWAFPLRRKEAKEVSQCFWELGEEFDKYLEKLYIQKGGNEYLGKMNNS